MQLWEDGPCSCSPLRLLCVHFAVTLAQTLRTAHFRHIFTFRAPNPLDLVLRPVPKF